MTLPGLRMSRGSSARLRDRISAISTEVREKTQIRVSFRDRCRARPKLSRRSPARACTRSLLLVARAVPSASPARISRCRLPSPRWPTPSSGNPGHRERSGSNEMMTTPMAAIGSKTSNTSGKPNCPPADVVAQCPQRMALAFGLRDHRVGNECFSSASSSACPKRPSSCSASAPCDSTSA